MTKKMISIFAPAILAAALAVMTACGGSSVSKPSEAAEKSETEATENETMITETTVPVSDTAVSFETVDIDGNKVSSADIFSQHKITMVNIWGTFCGPCINEMPDLEILNSRLAEKDCAIIGIICDVQGPDDEDVIADAREIIGTTGVTYLNLLPWPQFFDVFPAMYVPTTYFVDSSGQIIGEEAVGAGGADDYEALVDELLDGI